VLLALLALLAVCAAAAGLTAVSGGLQSTAGLQAGKALETAVPPVVSRLAGSNASRQQGLQVLEVSAGVAGVVGLQAAKPADTGFSRCLEACSTGFWRWQEPCRQARLQSAVSAGVPRLAVRQACRLRCL
jgi:hypothetical protein